MQAAELPRSTDDSPVAQALAHGYRNLKFAPELEGQFRQEFRINAHRLVRMAVAVAIITSLGFMLIDHWVIQATNSTPDLVRFGLQFPVLAICLLASLRRFYMRWYDPAIRIGLPLFGLGTVIMTTYAPVENMALIGARLLLVTIFCYFMLGLRLRPALACNAVVFGLFIATALAGLLPASIGWYVTFALLCANIIGAVGAYALEYASRTAFLERLSLEEMAARDGLTRLLNRQTFEFRARALWRAAESMQRSIAVIMIDVDYFKRYNDHYGHQAGDECLRHIAAAVRDAIDPTRDELVARYGGEEFIALLVDRSDADVEAVAQSIVAGVGRQRIAHSASVVCDHVSVSVGVTFPCADTSIPFNTLTNIADKALYAAKHQGRNRSVTLRPQSTGADVPPPEGITRPEARALQQRDPGGLVGGVTG